LHDRLNQICDGTSAVEAHVGQKWQVALHLKLSRMALYHLQTFGILRIEGTQAFFSNVKRRPNVHERNFGWCDHYL